MNREEKISLYGYIEDLYQAMQIGSITFEPKHSSELYELISKVLKENQELKKQLEEINNFINKAGFVNIQQLMLDYCAKVEQQKKFIEWLEKESKELIRDAGYHQRICLDVLEKYKEIIKIERN